MSKQYFLTILNNNFKTEIISQSFLEDYFKIIYFLMKNPGKHAGDDVFEAVGVKSFRPETVSIITAILDPFFFNTSIGSDRRKYYTINKMFMTVISLLEREHIDETISSALSRIRSEEALPDIEYNVDTIKNDKNKLIKYIQHIVKLETIIYSLEKRYSELEEEREKAIIKSFEDAKKQIISRENNLKVELENIQQNKEKYLKDIEDSVKKPKKPTKPSFSLTPPESPYTRKPGLFNRKKIIAENERLRRRHDEQLLEYRRAKDYFDQDMTKFYTELDDYLEECEKRKKEARDRAIEEYDLRYPKEKLIEEVKDIQTNFYSKINDLIANSECAIKNESIQYEQEYILHLLRDIIKAQIKLYSYGVIYGKYRSYVALSSFCDYLLAGRCTELEGPDGTYNLYELESRSDIVINKLDKILTSLDQIKENQYYIFNEIKTANDSLDMINGQLLVNNSLEVVEISKLNDIIANTNQTAYNTAVTAFYSKKNAELTDALGFMVAL